MTNRLNHKVNVLRETLRELERVVVAFSGGLDSTYLLKAAVDTLGPDNVVALTALSESYPQWEHEQARELAELIGVKLIEVRTHEFERSEYRQNQGNRCYFCKSELFDAAWQHAKEHRLGHVCYGAIPDDLGDHRPGMVAADEYAVHAPLIDAGITKDDIRLLSRDAELPTWNKPASACLASRFPFGTEITREGLAKVEACETVLMSLGFKVYRARYHEHLVRLELGQNELDQVYADAHLRETLLARCRAVGFDFVTIDLQGYRTGSANHLVQING